MKIIFAGTPVFAATALEALIQAGHNIVMVLTQPDRPAGRGMQMTASAVKLLAQQHHLPILQPASLKNADAQTQLQSLNADVMVVAAYGLILPPAILVIPRFGCLNIHASLLPRWRGAAPIQRAILAGDHETGITIMQMDAGLDTGDMLLKRTIAIAPDDTTQSLHDKLSLLGGESIVEALRLLQQSQLISIPQNGEQASYAAKITKSEAEIDWRMTAQQIDRMVRAFNPSPGAYFFFRNNLLKIWQASATYEGAGKPGEIVAFGANGILVACGSGSLRIEVMQKSGGKRMTAADFLAGNQVIPGEFLEASGNSASAHD